MLRIKQLIVIAGPSCAGKTFLLTSIRQGQCDSLCAQLGISDPSSCPQMQAVEIEDMNDGTLETVLVHFDFYTLDVPDGGYRVLSKLLDNADRVTILTLCAEPESLVERNNKRFHLALRELLISLLCSPKMLGQRIHLIRWLWKRRGIYKDPSAVEALYQKWATSIGNRDVTHYWLDSDQANTSAARPYETAQVGLFSNARAVPQRQQQAGINRESQRARVTTASIDFPSRQDAAGPTERRQRLNPLLVTLLKYAISISILAFLFQRAARDESFAILSQQQVNWLYVTTALVIAISASMISFLRLYLLVRAIDLRITFFEAARLGFLGILFSFLSLGVLGGDLIKALLLARRDPGRRTEALTAIFVDRMLGVYALFVIATVAILATDLNQLQVRDPGELATVQSLCWMTVGATLAGLVGICTIGVSHRVRIPLAESLQRAPRIGPIVQRVTTAVKTYRDKPLLMAGAALMSIGCHMSTVLAIYMIAVGLPGVVPSFETHLIIAPISLVAGSLPLPGGMGAFEFMLDFLYHGISPLAVPARQGFLVALAYRGITVIIALIGAACCLFGRVELSRIFRQAGQEQLENRNADRAPQATAPLEEADERSLDVARTLKKAA